MICNMYNTTHNLYIFKAKRLNKKCVYALHASHVESWAHTNTCIRELDTFIANTLHDALHIYSRTSKWKKLYHTERPSTHKIKYIKFKLCLHSYIYNFYTDSWTYIYILLFYRKMQKYHFQLFLIDYTLYKCSI